MNESKREFLRRLCKKSLYHFNKIIIGYTGSCYGITKDVHKPVLDFVQDDSIKRKGILMPRYFLKSSMITMSKPIWDWINNHEERIGIVNEIDSRARDFVGFAKKQIETNELLHYIFPETNFVNPQYKKNHQWSGDGLVFPREGIYKDPTIKPMGVGGASQGFHGTRLYMDDIIGKNAMMSETIRRDTEKWFDNVNELLDEPDQSSPSASHSYLIGTHYCPGDVYQRTQNKPHLGYQWKKVLAEDEFGVPTWPEKLNASEIAAMKSDPERYIIFYTQMQNNPMETDITDFKHKWLKYYKRETTDHGHPATTYTYNRKVGKGFEETKRFVEHTELDISAIIDPAVSEGGVKKTARTAIVVVGTDTNTNKHIVLEAWAKRISQPSQLYKQVIEFHEKYRPRRWAVETFAQQNWILNGLRETSREERVFLPITSLPKDVGKNAKAIRIRSLQDEFSSGDIYIHEDMQDLIAEYLASPMGNTNDILDALAWHRRWWTRGPTEEINSNATYRYQAYLQNSRRIGVL